MSEVTRIRKRPGDARYSRDPVVVICILAVVLGFGGFMGWAATAQLEQGITAPGLVTVKERRRTVQHLEGGIIETITAREGDAVAAGDVLMVISDATGAARFSQTQEEAWSHMARLDRIDAQLAGAQTITWTRLAAEVPDAARTELQAAEQALFDDERAFIAGELEVAEARIARLRAEAEALETRRAGKRREIETLQDEADVQNEALAQRMGNISRVNEVARMLAVTETDLANLDEDERVLERRVLEAQLELDQITRKERARLSAERADAQGALAPLENELVALSDRMARRTVIAPIDGVVIDLAYPATGAVIPPGETIMDLVPSEESYIIDVRFTPQDRDDLFEGRAVNLRFGTLNPISPPESAGILDRIAADATFEPQTGTYYYTAEVRLADGALDELSDYQIAPGIPVEVFFAKTSTRTPLSYFTEPLTEMLRIGLRS